MNSAQGKVHRGPGLTSASTPGESHGGGFIPQLQAVTTHGRPCGTRGCHQELIRDPAPGDLTRAGHTSLLCPAWTRLQALRRKQVLGVNHPDHTV